MSFRMGGLAVNMVQVLAKQVELPANGPNTHTPAPHLGMCLESTVLF